MFRQNKTNYILLNGQTITKTKQVRPRSINVATRPWNEPPDYRVSK